MEFNVVDWRAEVQVLVLLGVVVLHLPERDLAVLGAERNQRAVGRDGRAVEAADVLLEGDLLVRLVEVEADGGAVPGGGDEVQRLLVLLREEVDGGDPVLVLAVEGLLGLSLEVPVVDSAVSAYGDDVLL